MNWQFTEPYWLLLLPVILGGTWWLWRGSEVVIGPARSRISLGLRLLVGLLLVLALSGLRWLKPVEGMNVMFVLDRSESIPSPQQEAARAFVNTLAKGRQPEDQAGVVVFGSGASIESSVSATVDLQKIHALVDTERTDLSSAIRLATAAFPESGQRRIVLLTDGNENSGDALTALSAAMPLGVSLDVVPLGSRVGGDASIQHLSVPSNIKKGQPFEVKVLAMSDRATAARLKIYRNDTLLGEQEVQLEPGKNLLAFQQTLVVPGFFSYDAVLEVPGDAIPQNNKATAFANVRGDPRVLLVSNKTEEDAPLVKALQTSKIEVVQVGSRSFVPSLAQLQSYDAVFLSNVSAGDLGDAGMKLIESAVRDFGVGLVCVGGDQTYEAGGYRNTALERTLPVDMELNSKKVLPNGALALVVHATEFANGNQWARDIAFAALDALGPRDEMGIILWDGSDRWLFPLTKVGDKKELGRMITGMNPGDMPNFQNVMTMAYLGLKASAAHLKHMVVFSDGDPGPPSAELLSSIAGDKITISTVMIGGHVEPDRMIRIAEQGRGQFYDVRSPGQLPQIFIKEAAVILKSAIFEEPFKPVLSAVTEPVRGIGAGDYRTLRGYVATTAKTRAEVPLVTDKGDPLLAHWQYGLGRAVAFTSDAKAKWAMEWLGWERYQQFWSQIARWSLRRVDSGELQAEVTLDNGVGTVGVEAVDEQGNYRNFLNLEAVAVSPKGERRTLSLRQTGPGRYEAQFAAGETGSYLVNVVERKEGVVASSQVSGASVNYSPEFLATEPNSGLLQRLAQAGGGKVIPLGDKTVNPFQHDRQITFQPKDLWPLLLQLAILLFPLDVAVRRVQLERSEWRELTANLRKRLGLDRKPVTDTEGEKSSLGTLLTKKEAARAQTLREAPEGRPELFSTSTEGKDAVATPDAPVAASIEAGAAPTQPVDPVKPGSAASRLMEARRKAQRKP